MKNLVGTVVLMWSVFAFAQVDEKDSLSGGEIHIYGNENINSVLSGLNKLECPPSVNDTIAYDPCENPVRVAGYRIQIKYSKVRNEIEDLKMSFDMDFPEMKSELVYHTPDYKLHVGRYITEERMKKDLKAIKRKYGHAFPVLSSVRTTESVECRE